jgi:hypothetical protein
MRISIPVIDLTIDCEMSRLIPQRRSSLSQHRMKRQWRGPQAPRGERSCTAGSTCGSVNKSHLCRTACGLLSFLCLAFSPMPTLSERWEYGQMRAAS